MLIAAYTILTLIGVMLSIICLPPMIGLLIGLFFELVLRRDTPPKLDRYLSDGIMWIAIVSWLILLFAGGIWSIVIITLS